MPPHRSPLIGGLLGSLGSRAPFYAAAGLALANFAFGALVLPETVTEAIRRPFQLRRALPLGAMRHVGQLPGLGRLLVLLAIYEFALCVYPAVWAYYTPLRYGWDTTMVGLSLALFGAGFAIVQATLVGPILRRLGERRTILCGLWCEVAVLIAFGVLTSPLLALILTPLSALGSVAVPALQAVMSKRVGADAQGELQGVITATISLATILAPLVMTQVFSLTSRADAAFHYPGAVFALAAGLLLCGIGNYLAAGKMR